MDQSRQHAEQIVSQLSDATVGDLVMSFRLSDYGRGLTRELKQEWKDTAEFCKKRRLENFHNRRNGVHGKSKEGTMQEQMKLPRLATFHLDAVYGSGEWIGKREAMDYAWKKWPEFRLIDKK